MSFDFILYALLVALAVWVIVLKTELSNLKQDSLMANARLMQCQLELERQNLAIKKLEVKKPAPARNKIEKIYIKDKTCQSELKAYKELFNAGF